MKKTYYLWLGWLCCAIACQPASPFCGDGLINLSFEQCDDGNSANDDNCSSTCTRENDAVCGNGSLEDGEACDDANAADTDVCLSTCRLAFCGDGFVRNGEEQCDDGVLNSNTTPDACRTTCVFASCGDSILDAGEECDDGNIQDGDACEGNCTVPACGNSIIDQGEQCDDGTDNSDVTPNTCRTACVFASCGDSILDTGEQCDDGVLNSDATIDACRTTCVFASCGDSILDTGEQCDDGNIQDGDTCGGTCLLEFIVQVTVGEFHSCVLFNNGKIRCWGQGSTGPLGYGNNESIGDDETPASAGDVPVGGTVTQISAGDTHTCALLDTGNVRCWGNSGNGELGYGNLNNIGDDETPASAGNVNVGGTVTQISVGDNHTCGLLNTGNVRCWGVGNVGQLGYGNTNRIGDNETPSSAGNVNVGGTVTQISAGGEHTCALLDTGNVRCWGVSFALGYGNTNIIGDNETPSSAGNVNVGGTVTQISVGEQHNCALLNTGNVRCWGIGNVGQLGYGNNANIGDDETPASAGDVLVGGTVVQLSSGDFHNCALLDTGNVRCWGFNGSGELGYGHNQNVETPSNSGDVNVGGIVIQISAGEKHTCALLNTGSIRCWGFGAEGRLGYGNNANIGDDETPASAGDVTIF